MSADGGAAGSSTRLGASASIGPRVARHLVSPNEMIALFSRSVSEPSEARLELKVWREIQFLAADFCGGGGAVRVPRLAFHAIVSVTRGSVDIYRGSAEAPDAGVTVHEGQTIIEAGVTSFDYVWHVPHKTQWACISHALVRRLAEESGPTDPGRMEFRASLMAQFLTCNQLLKEIGAQAQDAAPAAQTLIVESVANA